MVCWVANHTNIRHNAATLLDGISVAMFLTTINTKPSISYQISFSLHFFTPLILVSFSPLMYSHPLPSAVSPALTLLRPACMCMCMWEAHLSRMGYPLCFGEFGGIRGYRSFFLTDIFLVFFFHFLVTTSWFSPSFFPLLVIVGGDEKRRGGRFIGKIVERWRKGVEEKEVRGGKRGKNDKTNEAGKRRGEGKWGKVKRHKMRVREESRQERREETRKWKDRKKRNKRSPAYLSIAWL